MSIFQLGAVLFAVFMIYVIRLKNRKYRISYLESAGWYSIWVAFAFLAIFPETMSGFVQALNFSRVFDLLLVGALMILTMLVFFSHFKIRDIAEKLEEMVRNDALRDRDL